MQASEVPGAVRSRGPAAWAARRNVHYGWLVVAVTFLTVTTATGARSAAGAILQPLEEDFGWSRSSISLAFSLSLLTFGLAAPLSGRLFDRFGIRATGLAFLALAGLGTALSATVQELWQLQVYWGLLLGLGTGGVSLVLSAAVANAWFEKGRGLVTGLLSGASSAGQLVFIPVLVWVTARWSWRAGVGLLAVLLVGVVLPAVTVFLRSRPADVGLEPYGGAATGATAALDARVTPMREALRTGDFWLLAGSFAICGFTTVGLIGTHFIPHATEHGFTEAEAAGVLSVLGAMNVVGTLASGWLCDRYPARLLLAGYYFFRALSLLVLPLITTVPLLSAFAVVYGFDYIATVPPTVMLTAERFGRRSVATIYGWITFAHMAGGALAAAGAGAIHDAAGDYAIAIYLSGLLGLVAAGLAFGVDGARRRAALAA